MKKIFFNKYVLWLSFLLLLGSCTKLDEQVLDEVLGEDASDPEGALAAAYDRLGKGTFVDHGGVFALQEYTTDEAVLATREATGVMAENGAPCTSLPGCQIMQL